jgi:hypothetical protein
LRNAIPGTVRRGGDSGKPHPESPRNPAEQGQILRKKHCAQDEEEQALKERECESGKSQDQQEGSECDAQIT